MNCPCFGYKSLFKKNTSTSTTQNFSIASHGPLGGRTKHHPPGPCQCSPCISFQAHLTPLFLFVSCATNIFGLLSIPKHAITHLQHHLAFIQRSQKLTFRAPTSVRKNILIRMSISFRRLCHESRDCVSFSSPLDLQHLSKSKSSLDVCYMDFCMGEVI